MSRDDSSLYSGMTSSQTQRLIERRAKVKSKKAEKKSVLLPVAELVNTEIDNQLNAINSEIMNIIHADMSEADVKSTVIGLRLAHSRMLSLKNSFKSILRTTTPEEVEDE